VHPVALRDRLALPGVRAGVVPEGVVLLGAGRDGGDALDPAVLEPLGRVGRAADVGLRDQQPATADVPLRGRRKQPGEEPSESIRTGITGSPRGAGPAVSSIPKYRRTPPPRPVGVVESCTAADPVIPAPDRTAPPTTPFTNRRRPVVGG
jgi:hypothetical protein